MFNEDEDEDEDIKDISYLLNEDEDENIKYISYLFNENEDADEDEDKIKHKEFLFKSIIQDIKDKLSKSGDKLIKKALYCVEEMKSLRSSEIKNIKEKLIIFKNELIRKNRINNGIKKDLDEYNSNIKYRGIKDIRYLFNEEDIYNSINDIKYLLKENEDKITHNSNIKHRGIKDIRYLFKENENKITHNSNIKDIRYLFNENEDKESHLNQ